MTKPVTLNDAGLSARCKEEISDRSEPRKWAQKGRFTLEDKFGGRLCLNATDELRHMSGSSQEQQGPAAPDYVQNSTTVLTNIATFFQDAGETLAGCCFVQLMEYRHGKVAEEFLCAPC